ncbi:unannotated protein [freshwater metagenome]|uniref:Unannotated protein n=1 Tax=freshwater metagenome TaxID=449393 RepID=A0A6J6ISE3_9ZZZZ
MIRRITFASARLAIKPQAISGLFVNSRGPGVSPLIVNAANKIAIVADDGIPSASSGIKFEIPSALFAASGPATP